MKLFISYAHSDRYIVGQLVQILRKGGLDPWFDHRLTVGRDWKEQLLEAIMECNAFVYCLSPESVKSEWCQWEFNQAVVCNKPIIPVLINDKTILPPLLSRYQYADFTAGPTPEGVAAVMGGLWASRVVIPAEQVNPVAVTPRGTPAQAQSDVITPSVDTRESENTSFKGISLNPVAIIVAVLGLIGILGAALIGLLGNRDDNTPPLGLPPLEAALLNAQNFSGPNADWQPYEESFDGVTMVLVPKGCFTMGSDNNSNNEIPAHEICFNKPFWIDKYEVTNKQFVEFDGFAANPSKWTGDNRPRETISWFEARDFCIKRGARLPTEAEWEYAARGVDSLIYPWGNDFIDDYVVHQDNSNRETADVGSKTMGKSWVGAMDMSGNVWEWVSTKLKDYPYDPNDGREENSTTLVSRALRGGSWSESDTELRSSYRAGDRPDSSYRFRGFRCARSID